MEKVVSFGGKASQSIETITVKDCFWIPDGGKRNTGWEWGYQPRLEGANGKHILEAWGKCTICDTTI